MQKDGKYVVSMWSSSVRLSSSLVVDNLQLYSSVDPVRFPCDGSVYLRRVRRLRGDAAHPSYWAVVDQSPLGKQSPIIPKR